MPQANFNNRRLHKDIAQRTSKKNSTRMSISQARFHNWRPHKDIAQRRSKRNSTSSIISGARLYNWRQQNGIAERKSKRNRTRSSKSKVPQLETERYCTEKKKKGMIAPRFIGDNALYGTDEKNNRELQEKTYKGNWWRKSFKTKMKRKKELMRILWWQKLFRWNCIIRKCKEYHNWESQLYPVWYA